MFFSSQNLAPIPSHKMPEKPSTIKIAIIGGGLAGASIANALLRHAHLNIHVYEAAPEFSERGAAVGLAGDSQRAMKQVVGESDAVAMLDNAGAVVQASSRLCIVRPGSSPNFNDQNRYGF